MPLLVGTNWHLADPLKIPGAAEGGGPSALVFSCYSEALWDAATTCWSQPVWATQAKSGCHFSEKDSWLLLKPTTWIVKNPCSIFIYLYICSLVWLYPRAAKTKKKEKKKGQGIRKESRTESEVTMRKYQWLQKHKQDTTALNTLPVRQTSSSKCDKPCVASPLLLPAVGLLEKQRHSWCILPGMGKRITVLSGLQNPAKHILLLACFEPSEGSFPWHIWSPATWMGLYSTSMADKNTTGDKVTLWLWSWFPNMDWSIHLTSSSKNGRSPKQTDNSLNSSLPPPRGCPYWMLAFHMAACACSAFGKLSLWCELGSREKDPLQTVICTLRRKVTTTMAL